jgi:restriction system protein
MIGPMYTIGLQNMSNNLDQLSAPVPDYQSLMRSVLEIAADGAEHNLAAIRQGVAALLKLSERALAERISSGSQTVFANRIAWAVQYLKAAEGLETVRRGVYRITDRGVSLLQANPNEITVQTLRRFPEFTAFHGRSSAADDEPVVPAEPADLQTPDESLSHSFELQQEALAAELLETVQNCTPAAFERLVVDLLVAMGYGGSVEDAGRVVGRSGDGGIDGIIKQDKLGLAEIYV